MSIISEIFSKIIFNKYKYIKKPVRLEINKDISITINLVGTRRIWFNAYKRQYPIADVHDLIRHLDTLNQKDLNKLAQYLIKTDYDRDDAKKLGPKGCIYWVLSYQLNVILDSKYSKPFSLGQFAIYDLKSLQKHLKQIGKEQLGQKNKLSTYHKLSGTNLFLVNFKKDILTILTFNDLAQMLKKYESQLLKPVLEFIKKYY